VKTAPCTDSSDRLQPIKKQTRLHQRAAKALLLTDASHRGVPRDYDFAAALLRTTKFLDSEITRCPTHLRTNLFKNILSYLEYFGSTQSQNYEKQ
jgi:hypothetical protein